jgi:biliverdin reductase
MVKIAMVGTGFVAHKRAAAIAADGRGRLVAVAGHSWEETVAFARQYDAAPVAHWSDLMTTLASDLVMVCHINQGHGPVTRLALAAGQPVVVEYPLALEVSQAEQLVALAQKNRQLLHVAHIELLGGSHQALKASLPALGKVHFARYCTLSPKRSRVHHWTYQPALFGFPLAGALSRIYRLVDSFGPVDRVYCHNHYHRLAVHPPGGAACHRGCLCTAQLTFASGLMAEVVYGKGDAIWTTARRLEVWGDQAGLVLDGDQGELVSAQGTRPVPVGTRRGLFAQDTTQVLDYLLDHKPLYCDVGASVYALRVAAAAAQSAATGEAVRVT